MFFPYNTDAPLYHPPITTVTMIVVNLLAFGLIIANPDAALGYILAHGDGLHPVQWVTSSFMHGGVWHLVGNMLSLWTFGLLVEGKIGWWRMAVLYLGIGIVQNAFEQTISLGLAPSGSLGASSIIFGLMAMSVLWAPKNDINCMIIVLFRPFYFEVSVLVLVGILLALNIVTGVLVGMTISTQTLHLMGAAIGFGVGFVMLRRGWVDCENWDLFSVMAGRHEMTDEQIQKLEEESPQHQRELREQQRQLADSTERNIRALIEQGRPDTAMTLYRKMAGRLGDWKLPERDILRLITALHKQKQWDESIQAMAAYLEGYSSRTADVRLKLAQIVLVHQKRPAQATVVLAKLEPALLDQKQQRLFAQLRSAIEKAKVEYPYDYVEHDW